MEALVIMLKFYRDFLLLSLSISILYSYISKNIFGIILMNASLIFLYFILKNQFLYSIVSFLIFITFLFFFINYVFIFVSLTYILIVILGDKNENIKG